MNFKNNIILIILIFLSQKCVSEAHFDDKCIQFYAIKDEKGAIKIYDLVLHPMTVHDAENICKNYCEQEDPKNIIYNAKLEKFICTGPINNYQCARVHCCCGKET